MFLAILAADQQAGLGQLASHKADYASLASPAEVDELTGWRVLGAILSASIQKLKLVLIYSSNDLMKSPSNTGMLDKSVILKPRIFAHCVPELLNFRRTA